jgi:KaiC/GvpD/RAD55 family RecA-like ATPase
MVDRLKTFINGLDAHLRGGIPKGSIVLVGGKPGAMKSSFTFNILYHNAKNGVNCAYITLEQSRESLLEHMDQMKMTFNGMELKFSVVDLGMIRKKLTQLSRQTWIEVFKMYVENLKNTMNISVLAIDSMQVFEVMAQFDEPREDFFRLLEWLRDMELTVFLIAEMDQDSSKFCHHGESFLSDGIIHLDMRREDRNVNLYVSIVKMRKTNHSRGYFPLIFDDKGFEVVGA